MTFTTVILAGGKSLRLGRDKALEKIGKQTLIERVVKIVSPISQEVIVVTSPGQLETLSALPLLQLKTRITADIYPGKGVLGGIYTGLSFANTFYSLVVACDMPFLSGILLDYLVSLANNFDLVVPKIRGMYEPLHAVYSKNCLAIIEQLLSQEKRQVAELFNRVRTRYVGEEEINRFDPEYLSFFNINTKADLRRARILLKQKMGDD